MAVAQVQGDTFHKLNLCQKSKKRKADCLPFFDLYTYFFLISSLTVSLFLPLILLLDSILRPFSEDILSLNPCLFLLFLFDGWKVLFITVYFNATSCCFRAAKVMFFLLHQKEIYLSLKFFLYFPTGLSTIGKLFDNGLAVPSISISSRRIPSGAIIDTGIPSVIIFPDL